jgi:hypothetical protein
MFEIHVNQNSRDIKPKKRKVESTWGERCVV